jgi:hypothetical protein
LWYCWLNSCQTAVINGTGYSSKAICEASTPCGTPPGE